jgi:hypothetical protein
MEVTEVDVDGNKVIVIFDDGHRAVFEPYTRGDDSHVEGLWLFFLYFREKLICHYDSRLHREGPRHSEHRIFTVAGDYTPQLVAKYWRTADKYLEERYSKKCKKSPEILRKIYYSWLVVSQSRRDLTLLEEGKNWATCLITRAK